MDFRTKLHSYYAYHKIGFDSFSCTKFDECRKHVHPYELCSGAEAHVGSLYGQPKKIVIVSLDRGEGAEDVWSRSACIEGLDIGRLNRHMKGTYLVLSELLKPAGITDKDVFKHFAMTNSAKCCVKKNTMAKAPRHLYINCAHFSWGEICELEPDIMITQGTDSEICILGEIKPASNTLAEATLQAGLEECSRSKEMVEEVGNIVRKRLFLVNVNGKDIIWLKTPYPAARDGSWNKFSKYVPVIARGVNHYWGI